MPSWQLLHSAVQAALHRLRQQGHDPGAAACARSSPASTGRDRNRLPVGAGAHQPAQLALPVAHGPSRAASAPVAGGGLRYDEHTLRAAEGLAAAMEDERLGQGPPGHPGFLRRRHYYNLVRDRQDGFHWLYRRYAVDGSAACTCGLLVPLGEPDALSRSGHLDSATGKPTGLLVGYASPGRPGTEPLLRVVCQPCQRDMYTDDLAEAYRAAVRHRRYCGTAGTVLPTGAAATFRWAAAAKVVSRLQRALGTTRWSG